MHNSISTAAQAIVSFASGSSSIDELKDILNREFSPVRSGNENDILWDRRIEAKGWIIEVISLLSKEQLEEVERIVLQIANKENLNNITVMKANKEFRIKITTNFYQAARNPIFKSHSNEAYAHDTYDSEEDAIKGLKELAINTVGDDDLTFESELEMLSGLISDHCYDAGISENEWIAAHPRLINFLAKQNGYTVPGIYSGDHCIFEFGEDRFEYDGYLYEIIKE